jgi:iron only hydrogenase large subunit-like protein
MAKKLFPQFAPYISMTLTPMVYTARLVKKAHPECKIAFIGPCAAKKLEASRRSIRSDVDFVLTFEEVMGMFNAKDIDFDSLPSEEFFQQASGDGKGFAVSGGVAAAVVNCIKRLEPNREIKVQSAEGLKECRKMLTMAKTGKLNGYLLEGMACPGGCIAGAGTQQPINRSKTANMNDRKNARFQSVLDNEYKERLAELEE